MSVQNISIMSWNCRGLNSEVVNAMIRDSSHKNKANFVFLQETKM